MKAFILGVIVGVVVLVGGALGYVLSGFAPVATAAPPLPFEKRLAKMAQNARIDKEMPANAPLLPDNANLVEGAKVYAEHCAVCHGLPGQPKTAIANGMYPEATEMFKGKGVTDDPPGENYWKASNGIRLSGMPSFKDHLSETQLWQVSLLVTNADKISPEVKAALAAAPPPEPMHMHPAK